VRSFTGQEDCFYLQGDFTSTAAQAGGGPHDRPQGDGVSTTWFPRFGMKKIDPCPIHLHLLAPTEHIQRARAAGPKSPPTRSGAATGPLCLRRAFQHAIRKTPEPWPQR
jgi:hypothetical protein